MSFWQPGREKFLGMIQNAENTKADLQDKIN